MQQKKTYKSYECRFGDTIVAVSAKNSNSFVSKILLHCFSSFLCIVQNQDLFSFARNNFSEMNYKRFKTYVGSQLEANVQNGFKTIVETNLVDKNIKKSPPFTF